RHGGGVDPHLHGHDHAAAGPDLAAVQADDLRAGRWLESLDQLLDPELRVTQETVLQLGRNALEMSIILAGPVLLFGLVAGLIVAVFQALTQIHEMTLTFIPKIGATILALALFGPWMLQKMLNYTVALFESVPGLVR